MDGKLNGTGIIRRHGKLRRGFGLFAVYFLAFCLVVTLAAIPTPQPVTAGDVGAVVDLVLLPVSQTVCKGDSFEIEIEAQCNGQDVVGIAAFIDFDPVCLEVQSVVPGDTLPVVLQNTYDNTAGTVDYSAGKLGEPFPSDTFIVATIEFVALDSTVSTAIDFHTDYPRTTDADFGGSKLRGLDGATVTVSDNSRPVLSEGAVSPESGTTVNDFTYSVTYTDADNDAPNSPTVSIDGGDPQQMTAQDLEDEDYTDGKVYEYSISGAELGSGEHDYQFAASDGSDDAIVGTDLHTGPTVSAPGGGGGGGGLQQGHTSLALPLDGVTTTTIVAESFDKLCQLTLETGTMAKTKYGKPLSYIGMVEMYGPPPPEGAHIIGLVYDFQPDGATFDPPAILTFTYDPSLIEEGVPEENLVIAYYDAEAKEWVVLESTVDPETNTITAEISGFSAYTVLGFEPRPAAFDVTSLSISPDEVKVGESVSIGVLVSNEGDLSGSYEVTLKIDEEVVDSEEVIIAGGASEEVVFTTARDVAGTHVVDVDGLTGSFLVEEPVAIFVVSDLSVSPDEAEVGESVSITVLVSNEGDLSGSYEVVLKIDEEVVASEEVTIAGGASEEVVFTTAGDVAGTHVVDVNGLTGSFVLEEVPPLIDWWVIAIIVGAVVVVGVMLYFLSVRRREET